MYSRGWGTGGQGVAQPFQQRLHTRLSSWVLGGCENARGVQGSSIRPCSGGETLPYLHVACDRALARNDCRMVCPCRRINCGPAVYLLSAAGESASWCQLPLMNSCMSHAACVLPYAICNGWSVSLSPAESIHISVHKLLHDSTSSCGNVPDLNKRTLDGGPSVGVCNRHV